MNYVGCVPATIRSVPPSVLFISVAAAGVGIFVLIYIAVSLLAPVPRPARASEKTYIQIETDGSTSDPKTSTDWQSLWEIAKSVAPKGVDTKVPISQASVYMTLVIPAYNEEERLGIMLKEAVEYLESEYPLAGKVAPKKKTNNKKANGTTPHANGDASHTPDSSLTGWEVILVSDGSTDATVATALEYAKSLLPGPSAGAIRVMQLAQNRGKGGAVTHGLRHARGAFVLFADADGATTFSDLGRVAAACAETCAKDPQHQHRAVAIGSRAHLVSSAAVVQRHWLRNLLMRAFHLFIKLLTPPRTARVKDTQCGFKLFSRAALAGIVPYMHMEGWIFDVEMLMLAESAGIPVVEVHVGWHEVMGSKLNVIWDSIGMAWGLAILRLAWGLGIYKRW